METAKKIKKSFPRNFTLIEMVIVIAIIALLAALLLVSVGKPRARARDTKRISDLREIAKALDLYRLEYDKLPAPWDYISLDSECPAPCDDRSDRTSGQFLEFLQGKTLGRSQPFFNDKNIVYLTDIPRDPLNGQNTPAGGHQYGYYYAIYDPSGSYAYAIQANPDGCNTKYYKLTTYLETPNSPELRDNKCCGNSTRTNNQYWVCRRLD